MKEIEIFYNSNGTISSQSNNNLVFNGENNNVRITVNFPEDVTAWEKYAYINSDFSGEIGVYNLGNGNPAEFIVNSEHLLCGNCIVGFEARNNDSYARYEPLNFYVSDFVSENINIDERKSKINITELFGQLDFNSEDYSITAKTKSGKQMGNAIELGRIFATKDYVDDSISENIPETDLNGYVQSQYLSDNYYNKTYVDNVVGNIQSLLGGIVNGNF